MDIVGGKAFYQRILFTGKTFTYRYCWREKLLPTNIMKGLTYDQQTFLEGKTL